jgi:hypothetical protein
MRRVLSWNVSIVLLLGAILSVVTFVLGNLAWDYFPAFGQSRFLLAPTLFWILAWRFSVGSLPRLAIPVMLLLTVTGWMLVRVSAAWFRLPASCLVMMRLTLASLAIESVALIVAWMMFMLARRGRNARVRLGFTWFLSFHVANMAGVGAFFCVGP